MNLSDPYDKRHRRTKAAVGQLEQQIIAVLEEDSPQSVRHVFYRMTNPRLPEPVEKSDRGYRHVQERLKQLRLAGRVPYDWITDSTRRGYHVQTYDSAGDFIKRTAGLYRTNLWEQSDYYCEVWVESRSIAGTVQADCEEMAVSLYPSGGFSSMTLAYEAAEYIASRVDDTGQDPVIIYIGDYDPAGTLIDRDIEAKLRSHLHGIELDFRRIAINPDQIATYDLPTKPRKAGERRAMEVMETVEAEAMPAHILRKLLRREIESLLPARALEVAKVTEQEERRLLRSFARQLADQP